MALYRKILKKLGKAPYHAAVIVAAGSSTRLGQDKLTLQVGGASVIERTLTIFQVTACIDEIVLVTRSDRIEEFAALREKLGLNKLKQVVVGGSTRAESSLAGVLAVSDRATVIGIHDAARPLITSELIQATYEMAEKHQAAVPTLPLKDTVKVLEDGYLVSTPPRDRLAAVQTPQVFQADLIRAALTEAIKNNLPITDDCSAVEALGMKIAAVEGSEENIKITTPPDVLLAEEILRRRIQ